jgi:hypothetical protein
MNEGRGDFNQSKVEALSGNPPPQLTESSCNWHLSAKLHHTLVAFTNRSGHVS